MKKQIKYGKLNQNFIGAARLEGRTKNAGIKSVKKQKKG